MREPTRYSLSGALSLLAHAICLLAFAWAFRVETDELEFDDEIPDYDLDFIVFDVKEIEPDKAQGEVEDEPPPEEDEPPAEEESAPPPIEQPEDPDGEAALPEPDPEQPPKPKFGEQRSKIHALVPPNATWSLVLANNRVRKLPFRDKATELMAPLADFRLLVDGAGFNIWEDFDYVVMGSPDATDQTQAFVAVQYNFTRAEMQAGVERGCAKRGMQVEWRETESGALVGDPSYRDPEVDEKYGDDRQFVLLPDDSVALYLREAFVEQAAAGPDASKGQTSGNFVANIARIRRYANAEQKAGVQIVAENLRQMIQVGEGFPIEVPSRAELMWEAATDPEIVVKLDFLESAHADMAETYWNEHLEADLRKMNAWALVGGIVAGISFERDDRQITLRYRANQRQAELWLETFADTFGKAMRWSKKEALEAKAERERMWELRDEGKLLPSEAIEAAEQPPTEGETGGAPDGEQPKPKPEGERPKPEPDGEQPVPDGEQPVPDGEQPVPDGEQPVPDGEQPVPDGEQPVPDGEQPVPDGEQPEPDGEQPEPDGEQPKLEPEPEDDAGSMDGDEPAPLAQ